jgi:hypothetical protein
MLIRNTLASVAGQLLSPLLALALVPFARFKSYPPEDV